MNSHTHRMRCVPQQRLSIRAARISSCRHRNAALRVSASSSRQKDNPLTLGLVALLTESLRVLGVGRDRYEDVLAQPSSAKPLRKGDVAGLMRRLKADFKQGYFITGVLDDSLYAPDCFFADPTISFRGVQLWKRNLQLLVPFLIEPRVELLSMQRLGRSEQGAEVLKATWTLQTYLALPWRPLIDIIGSTEYTLSSEANRVVEHVEAWNISGTQALLQILRPSRP